LAFGGGPCRWYEGVVAEMFASPLRRFLGRAGGSAARYRSEQVRPRVKNKR
jgi:hypothetical protein